MSPVALIGLLGITKGLKMGKLLESIEVTEDVSDRGIYHIPGINGDLTLCGSVDIGCVDHDVKTHPVNCSPCLEILKYCKNLRLPKAG